MFVNDGIDIDQCKGDNNMNNSQKENALLLNEILPWTFNCRTLLDAAREGRTSECEELIRLGADINETDDFGNTPVWTSYFHEHLETLFTLLQLGADTNTRSGDSMASDLHRACALGDRTLIEILVECNANVNLTDLYGKTPLIYSLEYPSSNYTFELVSYLVSRGAHINHSDLSKLTPLHYACYRGDPAAVQFLIKNGADLTAANSLGYTPLRYALSCLSYSSPLQHELYTNRLNICEILINSFPLDCLGNAIICIDTPQLFPLFDFLFYSLTQNRLDLEQLAWDSIMKIRWSDDNGFQMVSQSVYVYSYHYQHVIYLVQRMVIENFMSLMAFYVERVMFDSKPNRFHLLLYSVYVDEGIHMLKWISECFGMSLYYPRQQALQAALYKCQEQPAKLKFFCRRIVRQRLKYAIHRNLASLELSKNITDYALLDELNDGSGIKLDSVDYLCLLIGGNT